MLQRLPFIEWLCRATQNTRMNIDLIAPEALMRWKQLFDEGEDHNHAALKMQSWATGVDQCR